MDEAATIGLMLCIPIYPLGLAIMLDLALRTGRFERRHALIGSSVAGFVLGTAASFALNPSLGLNGETISGGLFVGGTLLIITFLWIALDRHFWITVLLAGLVTMISGSEAHTIVAASGSLALAGAWYGVSCLPFFVLGALTHAILRAGGPPDHPGYYHFFSTGRVLLLLLLLPILALLATCGGMITGGGMIMP